MDRCVIAVPGQRGGGFWRDRLEMENFPESVGQWVGEGGCKIVRYKT